MNRIYASRFYRGSKNKSEILAALTDPVNQELLIQYKDYITDDRAVDVSKKEVEVTEPVQDQSTEVESEPNMSFTPSGHSFTSGPSKEFDEKVPDEGEGLDEDLENEIQDVVDDVNTELEDEGVTSAQEIFDIEPSELAKELNDSQGCKGVSRVAIKNGNELYIYYSDNINLNSVMTCVIDHMDSYPVEFNRLARTENAIVFELNTPIKTVDGGIENGIQETS